MGAAPSLTVTSPSTDESQVDGHLGLEAFLSSAPVSEAVQVVCRFHVIWDVEHGVRAGPSLGPSHQTMVVVEKVLRREV